MGSFSFDTSVTHRKARYEAQIEYQYISNNVRQLQRCLQKHVPGAGRHKCAFVEKVVLGKNLNERRDYGAEHQDKSIEDFWEHVVFIDEAHVLISSRSYSPGGWQEIRQREY